MLRQIKKDGVESRLTDDALFIFRSVDVEDSAEYVERFEVYPIRKFGTPEEIMKALDKENFFLFEQTGETEVMPKFDIKCLI